MPRSLFDFSAPASVECFRAIDDRVMGGRSLSRLRHDPAGHAAFEGEVSLEAGGGFASVRSAPADLGWPGAGACVVEVRGDGKAYKLGLFTDDGFDSLAHQAEFVAAAGVWQGLRLPLQAFRPSFRGRGVGGRPPLDPARVRQVGWMIAGRQAGAFRLEIRSLVLA